LIDYPLPPSPPKMVPVGGGGFRGPLLFAVFLTAFFAVFVGAFFTAAFFAAFGAAFFGAAFLEVFFLATFHSPFALSIRPSRATSSS
jgi:hypothetical protein